MKPRRTLDVSGLPTFAFGARDPTWWGLMGLLVIEGTMFAITVGSYFYLRQNFRVWPPTSMSAEALRWAVAGVGVLAVSCVPMHFVNKAAVAGNLRGLQIGLTAVTLLSVVFLGCRAMELASLPYRWDSHAYGSLFWTMVGLHTMHSLIEMLENTVLTVLTFVGPLEDRHRVDIELNGFYWYFVVLTWLPLFLILYVEGGLLHR